MPNRGGPGKGRAIFREFQSGLIVGGVFLVLPLLLPYTALANEIVIFALAVVAFDLCLGFTGVMMFCQATFFGTGAYVTALTLIHLSKNIFVAMLFGMVAAGVMGLIIGGLATQRTQTYMVLLTLAFTELVYFIAYQWKNVTGGSDGLTKVPKPSLEILGFISIDLQQSLNFYIFTVVLFILSFTVIRRITISPFGKVLQGIRENEIRAQSIGYNTRLFKLILFVIGGAFMGLAGSLYTMFINFVHIDNIGIDTSAQIIIMELIGGMGTLFGPIVGAFIFLVVSDIASAYWDRWLLVLGILCIAFVLFARGGIWGLLIKLMDRMHWASSPGKGKLGISGGGKGKSHTEI